jgi:hypothetical protein
MTARVACGYRSSNRVASAYPTTESCQAPTISVGAKRSPDPTSTVHPAKMRAHSRQVQVDLPVARARNDRFDRRFDVSVINASAVHRDERHTLAVRYVVESDSVDLVVHRVLVPDDFVGEVRRPRRLGDVPLN